MNRRGFFAAFVGGSTAAAAPKVEKKPAGLQVESYASWMCVRCGRALVFEGEERHTRVMRCRTPDCREFRKPYHPPHFTAEPAPESRTDDAIGYAYKDGGHTFYVVAPIEEPLLENFNTYEDLARACAQWERGGK